MLLLRGPGSVPSQGTGAHATTKASTAKLINLKTRAIIFISALMGKGSSKCQREFLLHHYHVTPEAVPDSWGLPVEDLPPPNLGH